jgi:aldose 1-epimerase
MSGASYQVGDTIYNVTGNVHNGTALFNGGDAGWGRQTWDIAAHINNSITFVLFDRMWNGFPGVFASCLTHTVTPYQWRIAFGVTPLRAPGPINLSQQAFFNLDGFRGSSNATQTILEHTLHLPSAGLRFAIDELGMPTGDLLSNRIGQEHDFWSAPQEIGPRLPSEATGYDETFHISHKQPGNKEDAPVAILSSPRSGITMRLFADRDALHVHTWNEKDGEVARLSG